MGSMSTPVTAASERGQLRPTTAPLHHADGSPIRILVVDDEHTLTDLLQMALRYEGWEVKSAANGQQALTVAREFKPDAVVIIDSPEFTHPIAKRIRKRAPDIPIIDYVSPSVWAWRPGRAKRSERGPVERHWGGRGESRFAGRGKQWWRDHLIVEING